MTKKLAEPCPIIALDRFIQATRDSGYKGTSSAISELIDNSLQAGADKIEIAIKDHGGQIGIQVSVRDNGSGMDPFTLREALRFGGSSRFNDRSGLGRYGMGLPNSSLSQAQRFSVYTWREQGKKRDSVPEFVFTSYLDVDEIASGQLAHVPVPHLARQIPPECRGPSGTLVVWERCDRLDNRRVATLERKLMADLGRRFRHFVLAGTHITINDSAVEAIDPLFLAGKAIGATQFGDETRYEVLVDPDDPTKGVGVVRVRFSELPVAEWSTLSNEEKARRGISKGAGVSIVRGGREVDYGWFFMGDKRRENYDDWWRCEIQFDPILDEAFGITHTKQQIRPQSRLAEILVSDLEELARVLNSRVRKAHLALKTAEQFSDATKAAARADAKLRPLPARPTARAAETAAHLRRGDAALRKPKGKEATASDERYRISVAGLRDSSFFELGRDDQLILAFNPTHPFYTRVYGPLLESDAPRDREVRHQIELLLLSAVRAEAALSARDAEQARTFRREWSTNLAAFLSAR